MSTIGLDKQKLYFFLRYSESKYISVWQRFINYDM